jgi:hypothetical protein
MLAVCAEFRIRVANSLIDNLPQIAAHIRKEVPGIIQA